jgi:hypothetical protein
MHFKTVTPGVVDKCPSWASACAMSYHHKVTRPLAICLLEMMLLFSPQPYKNSAAETGIKNYEKKTPYD